MACLCEQVLKTPFMGNSFEQQAADLRPARVCLAFEAVLSYQLCRWVRRPRFPITILNKRLTELMPVVRVISLGQLTVTPLFTPKSMSASDVSSSRT